jgi:hypothetical protein
MGHHIAPVYDYVLMTEPLERADGGDRLEGPPGDRRRRHPVH